MDKALEDKMRQIAKEVIDQYLRDFNDVMSERMGNYGEAVNGN